MKNLVCLFVVILFESQAIWAGVPPGLTPTPAENAKAEEPETPVAPELQRSRKFFGFGPALFANFNSPLVGYSGVLGYSWDQARFSIRALGEFSFSGNGFAGVGALGAFYSLFPRDVSPYIGGDFGFGLFKIHATSWLEGELKPGFVGSLEGGVQILRTAWVGLGVALRWTILMNSTSFGIPHFGSLRVSLYF